MDLLLLLILHFVPLNTSDAFSTSLGDQDYSYLYDASSEIEINHRLVMENNQPVLLLFLKMRKDVYEIDDYDILGEFVNSYKDRLMTSFDTLDILSNILKRTRTGFHFKIPLNPKEKSQFYVLHFANKHNQRHYFYSIPLELSGEIGNTTFYFSNQENLPSFLNWNVPNNSYHLTSTRKDTILYAYYYATEFEAAEAPMVVESARSSKLKIDSVFSFQPDSINVFINEGLYFIQYDTTLLNGFSFRVQDAYYPRFTLIGDIINSMRYISTRGEWEALNDAENKKLALDDFWLAMLKSPSLAKNVIKRYFDQVEIANKLFTTYKEGWKTDMGMVYIILGNPDLVNRTEKSEEWIYEKTEDLPKMKFTFDKVPNIFTDNQFILRREKDFTDVWFKAIDMWRKGRFESIFK